MSKQNIAHNTTSALNIQKNSHSITKMKPKIRIVHIKTPEVIKIEPEDFYKFAQSLTGKSLGTNIKLPEPEISTKHSPINWCEESSNTGLEIRSEHNSCTISQAKRLILKAKNKATNPMKINIYQKKFKGSNPMPKKSKKTVHTQTPEVIEIKPIDFQALVQSLTGKSPKTRNELKKQEISSKDVSIVSSDKLSNEEVEILNDYRSCLEHRNRTTYEEDMTRGEEDLSDESLIGVEELDEFINELIDFHYLP